MVLHRSVRARGNPLPIGAIAEEVARLHFSRRMYAPGCEYRVGETILVRGRLGLVQHVRMGGNPKQGQFEVLTIGLPGGITEYWAGNVAGADSTDHHLLPSEQMSKLLVGLQGKELRNEVRVVLKSDARFTSCHLLDGGATGAWRNSCRRSVTLIWLTWLCCCSDVQRKTRMRKDLQHPRQ